MINDTLTIPNKLGLHARAASKLVAVTSRYQSKIQLRKQKNSHPINGKSIMALMMMEATQGANLLIEIDGPDEQHAYEAINSLIQNAFGEDE